MAEGTWARLPFAFRLLVWLAAGMAVAALGVRVYPHIAAPYAQAAAIEDGNSRLEQIDLDGEREAAELKRQVELADRPEGRLRAARQNHFVDPGQKRLLIDGVGKPGAAPQTPPDSPN